VSDEPKKPYENVILFPENKIAKKPQPVDPKAQEKMRDYQAAKFVETSTDDIGLDLIRRFVQMGLDTKQDVFTKDLAMTMDAVRGLLYRQFKLKHPIQKVIDQAVKLKMNKKGVVTARIEYANMTDESEATTKPLNKEVSDELNERNNGMFMFTEDFEFRPDFNPDDDDDGYDGPPSDTDK
tara:strand:+ start:1148 stop:1690 length:543 start_codon:yes stop_codon:yes gene_type:complete